ncbi:MAG: hypothetical protein U0P48_13890 [Ancrocorticia sp.]
MNSKTTGKTRSQKLFTVNSLVTFAAILLFTWIDVPRGNPDAAFAVAAAILIIPATGWAMLILAGLNESEPRSIFATAEVGTNSQENCSRPAHDPTRV